VATGIDHLDAACQAQPAEGSLTELAGRLCNETGGIVDGIERSAPLPPPLEGPPLLPAGRYPEGRPATPIPEYAHSAAPQALDPYGRSSTGRNWSEEELLEIPAFLRRKAD
jgi:cell division protein FtsZ